MPKVKITGMPRVKIVGLPKADVGMSVSTTTTMYPNSIAPDPSRDINGCIIGQEIYDIATGVCQPIDGGYNPSQDDQKNQPAVPVTNSSGQIVGGPASTGKIGPGTGVNPSQYVPGVKCPKGWEKNSKGECVPKKALFAINDSLQFGINVGSAIAKSIKNDESQTAFENKQRNSTFAFQPKNPDRTFKFGHVETVSGVEYPGSLTPPNEGQFSNNIGRNAAAQFGGVYSGQSAPDVRRIKIVGEPDDDTTQEMKYGGQSNYGFDSGWKRSFTEMNKVSKDYYTNSMSEDKSSDEKPVLEAEGGETLYKPGDHTKHTLVGPKHTNGGIKLNKDQVDSKSSKTPSFIYSDTPKMKIKDPEILKHFGFTPTKGGITPADISKKYDLNKYKAIIQDINSDPLAKATAQLMLDKNEQRLAELATIQENMKGLQPPSFAQQKLASVKFGGFVGNLPEYATGGFNTTDTTTEPQEAGIFTPEQIKAFGKDKVTVSERVKAGDTKVSKHQGATAGDTGTYGGITQNEVEELKKRHPWYFSQHPNWNPKNEDDVGDFQESYNEQYAKKHGYQYFVPKGSAEDRKFNRFDKKLGEYTYNAPAIEQDKVVLTTTIPPVIDITTTIPVAVGPRYICISDGKGGGNVQLLPSGMTGGYLSADEAAKHCGERPKKTKFDYLLPDKANMFAHAAIFPRKIFPFNPDLAFNPRPLALEDWRAKAAQRFSTQYAAPSAQLATFGPTQGLGANLSFLAGQTGQQMAAEDIAGTISRNVDRVNAFNQSEGQRQDAVDQFNNLNKVKRWEGYATTLQNYDNAMRGYLKENSDAFARAWKNRMHLGEINDTNPDFTTDATTGRQTWKGVRNWDNMPSGGASGSDQAGIAFGNYYKKIYGDMANVDLPDNLKQQQAIRLTNQIMDAGRSTQTTDPYNNKTKTKKTIYDFDFDPTTG